ncbi:MAG: O-antigen ligase family protein [Burkholderiales bacterium]|nr:O-antigen ligase family protein [Burkholderiales bacterium]
MTGGAALQRFTTGVGIIGGWSTIAIGASIPISIAFDNLLLAAALLAWLAGLQFREKFLLSWSNPVYRAALLLFAVLLLGTAYGQQAPGDAQRYLLKYLDLALIPVLGWVFIASQNRERALRILACGLALVLLISCALKIGLLPPLSWLRGTPESPFVVFKLRLTHNILMAFAAFLFAWLACSTGSRNAKLGWGVLGTLTVVNITLIVEGATGYILLIALVLLFGWQRARLRGVGIAVVAALSTVALLSAVPGPFQTRVKEIIFDLKKEGVDRPASTSTGYRMEFYRNTLTLIGNSPVFGTGTGSFPSAYAALVEGTGRKLSRNPHNEFMLITVQTGVIGLAAFLWLLWQQWRFAPQLPTPLERGLAQGLVLMMVMICMLNSALLDHTEGLLYAWLTALLYGGLKSRD